VSLVVGLANLLDRRLGLSDRWFGRAMRLDNRSELMLP